MLRVKSFLNLWLSLPRVGGVRLWNNGFPTSSLLLSPHLSEVHWEFLVLCRQLVFAAAPFEAVQLRHPSREAQVPCWGAGEGCARCGSRLWPQHGSLPCSIEGDGFLKGFWVVFPWLWETGSRMVPLLLAARCFTPTDWMLAKQHHSSLELSAKTKQINRNN